MKVRGLTFILNEDCNFRCVYCYKKLTKAGFCFSLARRLLVFFCRF
jgi:molybdenum cofactor biosynthesis enzyme MoaA